MVLAEPVDAEEAVRTRRIVRHRAGEATVLDLRVVTAARKQPQARGSTPPAQSSAQRLHTTFCEIVQDAMTSRHTVGASPHVGGPSVLSRAMAETMLDVRGLPKSEAYAQLEAQLDALLDGMDDEIAAMATISCVLHNGFGHLWTGFYRVVGPTLLRVGPYQGTLGCLEIAFGTRRVRHGGGREAHRRRRRRREVSRAHRLRLALAERDRRAGPRSARAARSRCSTSTREARRRRSTRRTRARSSASSVGSPVAAW